MGQFGEKKKETNNLQGKCKKVVFCSQKWVNFMKVDNSKNPVEHFLLLDDKARKQLESI